MATVTERIQCRLFCVLFLCVFCNAYIDEPIMVTAPGFHVGTIEHDARTNQIILQITLSASMETVPIIYMSKKGWDETFPDSDNVAQNPCQQNAFGKNNICCINTLIEEYQVSPSIMALYNNTEICPYDDVSSSWKKTYTMPSSANPQLNRHNMITGNSNLDFLSLDVPFNSSEHIVAQNDSSPSLSGLSRQERYMQNLSYPMGVEYKLLSVENSLFVFELRMNHAYIKPRARQTVVGTPSNGVVRYEFYIGVTFLTLLPYGSGVSIASAQVSFEYSKSDFVFFSIATEQDRMPVQQLDIVIHQAKSVNDNKLYQYIEVNVVYDEDKYPARPTIRPDSLRWLRGPVSKDIPDFQWNYACTSKTGYYYSGDQVALDTLAQQSCLPNVPTFCEFSANNRFSLPFPSQYAKEGGGFIIGPDPTSSLFLQFVLVLIDPSGSPHFSTIAASVDLKSWPVLQHCADAVFQYRDVTDALHIKARLGVSHTNTSSVKVFQTSAGNRNINEIRAKNTNSPVFSGASSYAEAAIAFEFDAIDFMELEYAKGYTYRIDNLVILNFLGQTNAYYTHIRDQIAQGGGFLVEQLGDDDHYTLTPDFGPDVLCPQVTAMGSISTAHMKCFWRRAVVSNEVQTVARESLFLYRDVTEENADKAKTWIRDTILGGDSIFSRTTASRYFADVCKLSDGPRSESRSYGCLFIDPGYRWISRLGVYAPSSVFTLSDKTLVVAILTIVNQDNQVIRRRLLVSPEPVAAPGFVETQDHTTQMEETAGNCVVESSNPDVNADMNIAFMTGHATHHWQEMQVETVYYKNVNLQTFVRNCENVMIAMEKCLSELVQRIHPVAFDVLLPPVLTEDYATHDYDLATQSNTTVDFHPVNISIIVEMIGKFGNLFVNELECILSVMAKQPRVLDSTEVKAVVIHCKQGSVSNELRTLVKVKLSTCAVNMVALKHAACNKLRGIFASLPDMLPMDNNIMSEQPAALYFSVRLQLTLEQALSNGTMGNVLRQNFADVFAINVDRVALQFTEDVSSVARRLLQTPEGVQAEIWLYQDHRADYNSSIFNTRTSEQLQELFRDDWNVQLQKLAGLIPGLSLLTVGDSIVHNIKAPKTSEVHKWLVVITLTLSAHALASWQKEIVFANLRQTISQDLFRVSSIVLTDISLRDVLSSPTQTTFLVWSRFVSREDAKYASMILRTAGISLRQNLVRLCQLEIDEDIRTFTVDQVHIEVNTNVVDVHTLSSEAVRTTPAPDTGVPVVVSLVCVLFLAVASAVAWYEYQHRRKTSIVAANTSALSRMTAYSPMPFFELYGD